VVLYVTIMEYRSPLGGPVGGLMNKLFVRSRGLLVVVTLALVASMFTASTARAASSSPSAGSAAGARTADTAASSAPCDLKYTVPKCQSTDPTVTLSTYAYGNNSDCTFVWDLNWGDGHTSTATLVDPSDGWRVTAQHIYSAPMSYTVTATGAATAGCTLNPFIVTFTLLPKPAAYSPKVHWSRTSGRPGKLVTLTGSGWAPGGVVQIHLPDKRLFIGITSWHADSHGNWKEPFAEEDAPPGKYKVSFTETSGHLKVTDGFTVVDPPGLLESFSNWIDACLHGKLQFDPTCKDELLLQANLKINAETVFSCVMDLKHGKTGIAACILDLGTAVGYLIYTTWQSWTHKR
jgi:hypothetical protein